MVDGGGPKPKRQHGPKPVIDWDRARADYEVLRKTQSEVARKYNVSRKAVQNHIENPNQPGGPWRQDVGEDISRAVADKVAGITPVSAASPEARALAIDEEATRRAAVELRHRDEWDQHAKLVNEVLNGEEDPGPTVGTDGKAIPFRSRKRWNQALLAKISAEMLMIKQAGERRAWRLDQSDNAGSPALPARIDFLVIDPADPEGADT
jgi:hypothetical protein